MNVTCTLPASPVTKRAATPIEPTKFVGSYPPAPTTNFITQQVSCGKVLLQYGLASVRLRDPLILCEFLQNVSVAAYDLFD